jgi:hypothetical protein
MQRCLFLILLFLVPNLLFALNEKECKKYFELAKESFEAANQKTKQLGNHPIETQIHLINEALKCHHTAIVNLDIILNHIHGLKSHKLRPWHAEDTWDSPITTKEKFQKLTQKMDATSIITMMPRVT